jgi:two-component system sensor histidine kinase RpfC
LPVIGDTLPEAPVPAGRPKGRRALVLEPNQTQRELACAALGREGAQVQGASGIAELGTLAPALEALDLLVIADSPQGLDLAQVHGQAKVLLGRDPPCLYLTYAPRRQAGRPSGVLCTPKPFLAEELVAAAEALLGLTQRPPNARNECAGLTANGSSSTAGIRVLVAEDNAIAAKVITTFLTKMGFAHTRVEDGEQALAEALDGSYGIAIVDLRMPKVDGVEFTRRYRAMAPQSSMPIVALTANASEDVKQTCLEAGMDDFLSKPVSPELLRRTVERLARLSSASSGGAPGVDSSGLEVLGLGPGPGRPGPPDRHIPVPGVTQRLTQSSLSCCLPRGLSSSSSSSSSRPGSVLKMTSSRLYPRTA